MPAVCFKKQRDRKYLTFPKALTQLVSYLNFSNWHLSLHLFIHTDLVLHLISRHLSSVLFLWLQCYWKWTQSWDLNKLCTLSSSVAGFANIWYLLQWLHLYLLISSLFLSLSLDCTFPLLFLGVPWIPEGRESDGDILLRVIVSCLSHSVKCLSMVLCFYSHLL